MDSSATHTSLMELKRKVRDLNEKVEEYFDRVITERMAGWKIEPVEEIDRQAITRLIYTNIHKPLSD